MSKKLYLKKIFLIDLKKKYLFNPLLKNVSYTSFFLNVDFPVLISCRQLIKKNLRNIYGQFYIGPFSRGQGLTVANSLRRILLSDLCTLAITSVRIENVKHQYQTIPGLQESVFDLLMNLKEIVLYSNKFIKFPQIGYLQIHGPCVVKAKDLFLPSFIQCVDSEQYIATLSEDGFLNLKFVLRYGRHSIDHVNFGFDSTSIVSKSYSNDKIKNYSHLKNNQISSNALNLLNSDVNSTNLVIDAYFNPVIKVNYVIELLDYDKLSFENLFFEKEKNHISIEQDYLNLNKNQNNEKSLINQEIIILEIWTNGGISPVIALKKSIQKLISIFLKIQKSKILNKINSDNVIYKKTFEKLSTKNTLLNYKQCQTFSEGVFQGTTDPHDSQKSFIQQLKYLINKLE